MTRSCSPPCPTSLTTTRSSAPSSSCWDREDTFEQLRAKNADGPRFSFIDGPVTANKTLAVHTAWGRTLKDVFQRYKALQGYHQRYQNGFDCQGLWIEVGVERELGLNSKREIEEYGLAEFARRCRAVVEQSSAELTKGSIRLGQWMDWGRDYFTFSDTNIEYIWRFLAIVHERGLAVPGPPGHRVVPAVRHLHLGPRAGGELRRPRGPVADGAVPAARSARPGHRHLDHHPVDAAGQRGRRRLAHGRVRAPGQRRLARGASGGRRGLRGGGAGAPTWSASATRAPSTPSGPGPTSSTG